MQFTPNSWGIFERVGAVEDNRAIAKDAVYWL